MTFEFKTAQTDDALIICVELPKQLALDVSRCLSATDPSKELAFWEQAFRGVAGGELTEDKFAQVMEAWTRVLCDAKHRV